jgi:hypothetical protein
MGQIMTDRRHRSRPRLRHVNAFTRWVLRTPVVRRLADRQVIEIRYTDADGRPVALPVMYAQRGERLIVLVGGSEGKRWWRHFTRPHPVQVLLRGAIRSGTARVVAIEDAQRREAVDIYATRYPDIPVADDPLVAFDLDPSGPEAAVSGGLAPPPSGGFAEGGGQAT